MVKGLLLSAGEKILYLKLYPEVFKGKLPLFLIMSGAHGGDVGRFTGAASAKGSDVVELNLVVLGDWMAGSKANPAMLVEDSILFVIGQLALQSHGHRLPSLP